MGSLNLAFGRWAERLPRWRPALADLRGWVVPVLLLVLLETLVRTGVLPSHQLPAPSQVAQTLYALAVSGDLWRHLNASLLRVAAGFLIGAALAIVIGTWVGLSRRAEAYLEPTFQ
ncbi:MAG TPA: ABC transporter permease, partial [Pseudomonas sp.]|nr:ABC transporter permease [Pseudomonas sp.]